MPDLSIVAMHQCSSLSHTSVQGSKGETYHLHNQRGVWTCTCKGYQFRSTCKHVKDHCENGCMWHEQIEGGEVEIVNGVKCCPRCGSPVETVMCGV